MSFVPMELETRLKLVLQTRLEGADGRTPPNVADAIRYSLLAPGKRIRPRLTLATAEMLGLKSESMYPAAIAIEMVHCFTLIHDDLPSMDNDDFRRGRPSNHKQFGEAMALLAGDALTPMAIETLLESQGFKAELLARGAKRLAWASGPRGVVGGQAAEALLSPQSSVEDLRRVHALKTGALFVAAVLIPKDLAGITDESSEGLALEMFAKELGLAFQAADDLEDAAEEPNPTNLSFYVTKAEAASVAAQRLRAALTGVVSIWGQQSGQLELICNEVLHRLDEQIETPVAKKEPTAPVKPATKRSATSPNARAPRR